jgi:hypothetical protein
MTSSSTRDGCNPSDRVESSSSSRSHDNSDVWLTRNRKITSVLKPDSSDATIVDMQSRDALPSARIKEEQLRNLSQSQRNELLNLLDDFSQCFSDKPGFCPYIEHRINVSSSFKPKHLKEYRIPEILKPEIQRQIDELLRNGYIHHSTSSMASPIVPVLKGPSGQGGVRLAIDFRYVNSFLKEMLLFYPVFQMQSSELEPRIS